MLPPDGSPPMSLQEFPVPRLLSTCLAALLFCSPIPALAATAAPGDPAALIEAGHLKQARELIEAREKSSPDDPATVYFRARLKLIAGEASEALPLAEQAATLDPKNADYRYQVAACVGRMAQHAGVLKQLGLAKRFKREAEAALALDPRNLDAVEGLIQFYSQAPGIAGGSVWIWRRTRRRGGLRPSKFRLARATGTLGRDGWARGDTGRLDVWQVTGPCV